MEGRDTALSSDWRGEAVGGVTMDGIEGMDMVGMGVAVGCSDTSVGDSTVGDCMGAGMSVDGRGEALGWLSCAFLTSPSCPRSCSSCAGGAASAACSGGFVACNAGLSGREPMSDDARESVPLITAFARRSCSLELGLLREELRDTGRPSASTTPAFTTSTCECDWGQPTWLHRQLFLCSCLLRRILLLPSISWLWLRVALGIFGEDAI